VPDFLVPDLGEGLEDATVLRWLVGVGDDVELNQVLCIVETAKAEVEVPSPYAGAVTRLGGAEGETLAVGALLARIGDETPVADPVEPTSGSATLVGYGYDRSIDQSHRVGVRAQAKPPVRKLARDLGVDLAALAPGRGRHGIVTRADVEAAAGRAGRVGDGLPTGADPAPLAHPLEVIAVRGVRAVVAERMAHSRTLIPDATCSVTVDCARLLEVRAALNDAAAGRGQPDAVTPFSLLCRFAVQALASSPMLNATFVDEGPEIHVARHVHLGVGTATGRGLVVTVVRDAHTLGASALAEEMARLAASARAGAATPAELRGSTFTVSNFGSLGLDEGIPVINHPEAAILGVGSIRPRAHVVDGAVVARPTASLTLAFDHRVCDGADAGRYLTDLRARIERPELGLA
jgi:pyruvate dehydrogenase E2 component (dihydrolipoamide acetyltransferase)